MRKTITMMLVLILLLPNIYSLGIGPGKTTVEFNPGKTKTVNIDVFNNDKKDFTAFIVVDGELKEYITLSTDQIEFKADEPNKGFSYTITLPDELPPGLNTAQIKVKAVEKTQAGKAISINTNIQVITKVFVYAPYPGKYAEASIKTTNAKMGDDIKISISVFNLGEEAIKEVSAVIDIYDPQGRLYNRLTTAKKAIESKKVGELAVQITSEGFVPGQYTVNATVIYDGNEIPLLSSFSVDDFLVKLLSVTVDDYTWGDIAKFSILVKNIGNRLIENAYARIVLKDTAEVIVANMKSHDIDLEAQDTMETSAYWDTKDIDLGEYFGKIGIYYEDQVIEHDVRTNVNRESIEFEIFDITAMAIADTQSPKIATPDSSMYLIIIIVLLAVIAFILAFKKFGGKRESKTKKK